MLTDAALRNIRAKSKSYKMTDRDGLYLLISPKGGIAFKYLEKVCSKFRVRTRIEAVAAAVRLGFIDPG